MNLVAGIAAAAAGAACGWPASAIIRAYVRPEIPAHVTVSSPGPAIAADDAAPEQLAGAAEPAPGEMAGGRAARTPAPVAAAGAVVILAGLGAAAGLQLHQLAIAVAAGWLAVCGFPLAVIDVRVRRLPDPLTAAAFAGVAVGLLAAAISGGAWGELGRAAAGAVLVFAFFAVLALLRPGSAGLGDAKLGLSTGALAAWCGWQILLASVFAAFALAAVCGLALLAAGRTSLRSGSLPFGPFLLAGCIAFVLLSPL